MALPAAGVVQAFVSTIMERHEVVDSHLTEIEQIRAESGDQGVRRAMSRMLRMGDGDAAAGARRMDAEGLSLDVDDPVPPDGSDDAPPDSDGGPGGS
jgi:hypothetical protein